MANLAARARTSRQGDERNSAGPLISVARHQIVDALRGFALLGILIVNVEFIVQHADVGWTAYESTTDLVTRWFVTTFGQLKVYPLFALLFGYGLSVQLDRAANGRGGLGPRYGRRMVGLVVLGVAHGVLFFPGDILTIYAVVGSLAYLLRRRSSASLLRIAALVYGAASAIWLLVAGLFPPTGLDLGAASAESVRVLATGSFGEVLGQHLAAWPGTVLVLGLIQGPAAFAFVLVGVVLGRTDVLTNPARYRQELHRVLAIGGPIGLVVGGSAGAASLAGGRLSDLGFAVGFLVAPAMSAAYLAVLLLVWGRAGARPARLFQSGGRMSLSVYLLESVAVSAVAYGYGLGLVGRVSPLQGVLLAIAVWLGLSLFAMAWLRFARFGPFEWALRSVSYWRIQPIARPRAPRKSAADAGERVAGAGEGVADHARAPRLR